MKVYLKIVNGFFLFFLLAGQLLTAQNIKGIIVGGEKSQYLAYANIYLLSKADSSIVTGTMSGEEGAFKLACLPGEYTLVVQAIGYKEVNLDIKQLLENEERDVGMIKLGLIGVNLEEVVVRAEKSRLEHRLGKKVLWVGADIASGGNSVLDALENLPSVQVSMRGDIQIRGDGNVLIYINGRPSRKDGKALSHFSADLVERIELITNPSAEYEAEGVGGIINIIFKKQKQRGMKIELTNTNRLPLWLEGRSHQGSFSGSYRTGKFNFYANLGAEDYRYQKRDYVTRTCRTSDCDLEKYSHFVQYDGDWVDFDVNAGLGWMIDSTWYLESDFTFQRWDSQEEVFQEDQFVYKNTNPLTLNTKSLSIGLDDEYELNTLIQKNWSKKKRLAINLTIGKEKGDNSSDYNTEEVDISTSPFFQSIQLEQSIESEKYIVLKGDYQQALWGGKLKTGGQSSFIKYLLEQQLFYYDPLIEKGLNDFDSEEQNHALYMLHQKEGDRINWKIGTRIEYFNRYSIQQSVNDTFQQKFISVFPSAAFDFKLNKANTLSVSYSRRVRKPRFFQVNPFTSFDDPLNVRRGNPDLAPAFANSIELTYAWKKRNFSWLITGFDKRTNRVIREIFTAEDDLTTKTYGNFGLEDNLGVETSIISTPWPWLKLTNQFTFYRRKYSNNEDEDVILYNDFKTWYLRFVQEIKIPGNWKIQIKENYQSTSITPQIKRPPEFVTNIAIRKSFNKNKWSIALNFSDVFDSNLMREFILLNDYELERDLQFQTQKISLTLKYKFQKKLGTYDNR